MRVRRDGDALHIEGDGVDAVAWPLAEISASPRLGSTPRILRRHGFGQIECADSALLESWLPTRRETRVEAVVDWLERQRIAILAAAAFTVLATIAFVKFGVPWVAQRAAEHMPVAVERHVSDQVVALLERFHLDPSKLPAPRRAALQEGFADLVRDEPRADQMRLDFVSAPTIGPNAFALPDGRIYMTDELVALAKDDEEILAVLAHEAGHHVHRHGMRQAIESSSVFVATGLLFGDLSGSSIAVALPAMLLSNGFSRGHEREADNYAFGLLIRREISPAAFARIMERLAEHHGESRAANEGVAGYLSTHPATPERILAARVAAGE